MQPFPFSAIVGQDALRRALLLGVIQPSLGGVLVRGTKGLAKSTAVRAMAGLLPAIETVAGCPFQRRPGEISADWPLPADAGAVRKPAPLVELPLGATEDRVLGSLHLERALRGERAFEPGLLAAANRGILYIDEVNLLADHLVDILLDAAASGTHRLEREGLSLVHPARFLLVGTMNPEEGDLRPQLLDRFGLAVDVHDLADHAERAEAVRRRLAFEADPERFHAAWQAAEAAEAERIVHAQQRLPGVRIGDDLLSAISQRCLAEGVEGLRADLVLTKAACAWAAYQGRSVVDAGDVDAVAELALVHRRNRPPEPPRGGRGSNHENGESKKSPDLASGGRQPPEGSNLSSAARPSGDLRPPLAKFDSAGVFATALRPANLNGSMLPGRRRARNPERAGPMVGPLAAAGQRPAWSATIRQAALHQVERGRHAGPLILQPADIRFWRRHGPAGCLLLFVIDASGSMAAWKRMRQTKAAVLSLLLQSYRQRDRIAMLAFRGAGAELVLPPTRSLRTARQAIEELPVGGPTPLAAGLTEARKLVRSQKKRQPQLPVWTIVLTDGKANVGTSADAFAEAKLLARASELVIVDTETGWPRFGQAAELAKFAGAHCLTLEEVFRNPPGANAPGSPFTRLSCPSAVTA